MSADADFSKSDKKNNEQVFVDVKRFLTFNSLLETSSEKLLKRTHNNDSNVSVTASTFN